LLRTFWLRYLRARVQSGDDTPFGDAAAIFEPPILRILQARLSPQVLTTQVFFTDRLSDRVLAGCLRLTDGSTVIALNVRAVVSAEVIAHTLVEEFVHAQQMLDGVDFDEQRKAFSYAERPYELEAKRIATEVLGYDATDFQAMLLRDEPEGPLFDHPSRV
jgi:hypothetical protein